MISKTAVDFLIPSLWEVQVTVAAAAFVIAAYWFFTSVAGDKVAVNISLAVDEVNDDKQKIVQLKGESHTNSAYMVKVELLAAKNLIGANLNGTSDPYAIITCGTEKRFRYF